MLLPDDAKINIRGDKDNASTERVEEDDKRISGVIRLRLSQPDYTWRLLIAAKQGSSSIDIVAGAQKKTLTVNIKAYEPHMVYMPPKPYTIVLGQATRESPFSMYSGLDVEITLPGELKDGWRANDANESGVVLQKMEQLSVAASADHPQVKFTFSTSYNNARSESYHLVIKRGCGLISGESFHLFVRMNEPPKC